MPAAGHADAARAVVPGAGVTAAIPTLLWTCSALLHHGETAGAEPFGSCAPLAILRDPSDHRAPDGGCHHAGLGDERRELPR